LGDFKRQQEKQLSFAVHWLINYPPVKLKLEPKGTSKEKKKKKGFNITR